MEHNTVVVLGASGFIGTSVINRLVARGHVVKVATRRRAHAQSLLMLPVDVVETDIHDLQKLTALVSGCDAVINLVGVLHGGSGDPYGPGFSVAHVELPQKLVLACRATKLRRVVHVSALHADPEGPSMYLRSKGDGERVLRDARELQTTIFRPSIVFGPGDRFLNTFAKLQRLFPVIPLACPDTRIQPVFVGDLADAIVNALDLDLTLNTTYDVVGPRSYTLEELVRFAGVVIGHPRKIIRLPSSLAHLQALSFEMLPGEPQLTRDNLASLSIDVTSDVRLPPELGVRLTSLEAAALEYMRGSATQARFDEYRAGARR
ncbi:complex I NDUFA9 subunit family protein [Pararobbsia silviterrae]|uniref:Complex I NDUFA9 subunit family protein n=1 Tax=Pararobbsia silviterrae TaxID=1792498 RepID=A0A494YA91_9BURK|nr:complex I NDUFA9 subunit family protein [Pararobbsia silviterrae]RKP58650.1 complex I NDUFA9 subunit family protein [Pararobbsia silviterrae]